MDRGPVGRHEEVRIARCGHQIRGSSFFMVDVDLPIGEREKAASPGGESTGGMLGEEWVAPPAQGVEGGEGGGCAARVGRRWYRARELGDRGLDADEGERRRRPRPGGEGATGRRTEGERRRERVTHGERKGGGGALGDGGEHGIVGG